METRKATALLGYICLSSTPLSRECLAALFWGEFRPERAQGNLRRALYSINNALGPGVITSNRETVSLVPAAGVWQDVDVFQQLVKNMQQHFHDDIAGCPACMEALEKAIALQRGSFMEGINLGDCPEFDDWQYLQREGFRHELAGCLEKMAQAHATRGDWEKAIHFSRRWVNLDALDENPQRMLIRIYALAGQRSAALRQYEECERLLESELGQPPEPETQDLIQKIQAGETGNLRKSTPGGEFNNLVDSGSRTLIKTKLFAPPLPAGLIPRPHLYARLEEGVQCALTLISAPAGYGKTTLLTEWIETRRKLNPSPAWKFCWISLDPADNDPTRFLTYLTAGLENINPGLGAGAQSLLQSSESLPPQTPLSLLINDLQAVSQSVCLVLDDYQFIDNPTIHQGMIFLLEHLPVNVQVVIATRSDPPLPLARLRARNQLNEIRARDLRFDFDEITSLLNNRFQPPLTPGQIEILEKRTEGWAAGLQMAAISMRGRLDFNAFIEAFSGSNRFIMDYLAEEVLHQQTPETQGFLLQTSILERLSAPLCDFILDPKPAQSSESRGTSLNHLLNLELSNLFIIPLDDERTWYRYHHLFADLLRNQLKRVSPELIPVLHARASAWFEEHGWIEEAIDHTLAARDWDRASRLVNKHIQAFLTDGQMTTVFQWIERMPREAFHRNASLCTRVAELYAQSGRIDLVDPLLDRAEAICRGIAMDDSDGIPAMELTQREGVEVLSMVGILRGLKAICIGDPAAALRFTGETLQSIPDMEPKEKAILHWVEGWANRSLGNLNRALELLTRATEYARESGAVLRDIWTDLAVANWQVGKLPQAINIFTNALQTADQKVQNQGNHSRDETFLSVLLFEQNQLDRASMHANRAIACTQWWPSYNIIASAYAILARILLVRNNLEGSLVAIRKADEARQNRLMTPYVHSMIDVTWAHIWLEQGEWAELERWMADQLELLQNQQEQGGAIDEYLEMRLIMVVRLWMEKTKLDKDTVRDSGCLELLARLEESSRTAGRANALVEILLLKECLRHAQGRTAEALQGMDECLWLAERGGYMRIFLETGEPARALLTTYINSIRPAYKPYALRIIRDLGGMASARTSMDELPESITNRELDVLRLLAGGCSNRQIAETLVLSEGTVKFHVHNILQKLQVDNRTQAIVRARDLDLI